MAEPFTGDQVLDAAEEHCNQVHPGRRRMVTSGTFACLPCREWAIKRMVPPDPPQPRYEAGDRAMSTLNSKEVAQIFDAFPFPTTLQERRSVTAAVERIIADRTDEPHAYVVEVLWNRGSTSQYWGRAMEMSDVDEPLSLERAQVLMQDLVEDGHRDDTVRICAITSVIP